MLHCGLYLLRYHQTVTFSNPCIAASVQELIYVATRIRKQRQERNRQPVRGRLYTSPERNSDCPAVFQLGKNTCERDSRGGGRRRPLRDGCDKNTLSQIDFRSSPPSSAPACLRLPRGVSSTEKQGGFFIYCT